MQYIQAIIHVRTELCSNISEYVPAAINRVDDNPDDGCRGSFQNIR